MQRPVIEGIPGTPFQDEVVIRRLRWSSDETGFAIIDADRAGDEVVLVGTFAHLEERERVRIERSVAGRPALRAAGQGRDRRAARSHGRRRAARLPKRVRHVGGRRAARLLDLYGEGVLDVIDRDPRAAFRRLGLGPGRITEAVKSWDGLRSSRALHLLLAPHGLAWLVPRIEKHYGSRAHRVVRERPYDLTSVFGVGFQTADTIARSVDVPADSPARTRAGVLHVLSEAERAGSTCLPVAELAARAGELLGVAPDAARLNEMADADELVLEIGDEESVWAYRPEIARLERDLAEIVRELAAAPSTLKAAEPPAAADPRPVPSRPRPDATERCQPSAIRLAPAPTTSSRPPSSRPRSAPRSPRRLSIVTGGPGTGKTATIRLICAAAARAEGLGPARRPDRPSRTPDDANQAASTPRPSTPPSAGSPARAPPSTSSTPTS